MKTDDGFSNNYSLDELNQINSQFGSEKNLLNLFEET